LGVDPSRGQKPVVARTRRQHQQSTRQPACLAAIINWQ
jgi:hypothetical protein